MCLLVGAFNPFTFKVIIDIYVPIAILLIVWDSFCRSFSSLVFLDYISPFNICCKAGLVVLNSVKFCLSEKLFIPLSVLNEILVGYSNLGCRFFPFITLNTSCHSFLSCRVSAERSAVKCMGFPLYVTCCFSLVAIHILSLCLVFVSLISMCLGLFILYGTLCASWTWLNIFFSMLGKFSPKISPKIFSKFFFFFFWNPYNLYVDAFDMVSEVSETICGSFHSFYFILLFRNYFHHFILQLTDSFFCFRYSSISSIYSYF